MVAMVTKGVLVTFLTKSIIVTPATSVTNLTCCDQFPDWPREDTIDACTNFTASYSTPSYFILGKTLYHMWQQSSVLSIKSGSCLICDSQVLPGEKCNGSVWNDESSFRRTDSGKDTGVWI